MVRISRKYCVSIGAIDPLVSSSLLHSGSCIFSKSDCVVDVAPIDETIPIGSSGGSAAISISSTSASAIIDACCRRVRSNAIIIRESCSFSAITAWLMLPSALIRLFLSSASQISSLVSLLLFALSMALTWRMTNATIGKGAAIGTAVFVGMFIASLLVLFGLQMLLGISVPDDVGAQSLSGLYPG